MRAIHLTINAKGGAGVAASRAVAALGQQGIDAELWTADGAGAARGLRRGRWSGWRTRLTSAPLWRYRKRQLYSEWSNEWLPSRLASQVAATRPDIVHLHWIGGGFLGLRELPRLGAPVVWTLHDAWAFTGGCHYPDRCGRYTAACGRCPQLGSGSSRDLSWRNLRTKRARLGSVAAFVTPSAWLAGLAAASGTVDARRLHVIPNGLDGKTFAPADMAESRAALGLPADAVILLAGAQNLSERRKGCHLLREVVARLAAADPGRYMLVLFGAGQELVRGDWPCEVRGLGTLREEQDVARACSAADVLLLPSLQDNFPNIALEAQACGCPVVGFDAGGLREIIEPGTTGGLATEITAAALGDAVRAWLAAAPDRREVSARARVRFEREFSLAVQGRRLAALYAMLLGNERPRC